MVFRTIKSSEAPITDPLSAIPHDAALILKSNQPLKTWDKLSTTNIMWEELMLIPHINILDNQFSVIDTLIVQYPEIKDYLASQGFFMSLHPNESSEFDILFAFGIPNIIAPEKAEGLLHELAGNRTKEKLYKEIFLHYTSEEEQMQVAYAFVNNVLVVSSSIKMVEKAIDQSLSGTSITENPSFQKCYDSRGTKEEANVLISYRNISKVLSAGFANQKEIPENIHHFGTWAATDLTLRPNELQLHGFTVLDSTAQFLASFKGQKASKIKMFSALPEKTASAVLFSFSSFKGWYKQYREYLNSRGKLAELDDRLNEKDEKADMLIEDYILEWVESEMGLVHVRRSKSIEDTLIVLRSSNPDYSWKKLNELARINTGGSTKTTTSSEYTILEMGISNFANLVFGDLFPTFKNSYCVQYGKYIFLVNSLDAANRLTADLSQRKLLTEDRYFNQYADNIPEANYLLYTNIASSYDRLKKSASETPRKVLDNNEDVLKKFQALSMSWSNENDELFYQNVYLKFNPIFKEETSSIWEYKLAGTPVMKPALVKNHYTNAKEIFTQDNENNVYLISNTGKLLWKRKIKEPIKSDIYQIDIYKNDKLQMVFNTENYIYVLDRNGKDVASFPVQLDAPATNKLSIIDYTNSKEYRLFIACNNNKLYNYDKKGVKIKGWAYKADEAPVTHPVRHTSIKNKDYLVAILENGKVKALNRRGDVRINFKEKLNVSRSNDYQIFTGKALNKSFIISTDSLGLIVKLYFDDRKEVIDLGQYSSNHNFRSGDINKDGDEEFILIDGNKLRVFEDAEKLLFEQEYEGLIANPKTYHFNNQTYIGFNNGENLWLIDRTGKALKGFPMKGGLPFSVADINKDGKFDLIAEDKEGNILVYELE